MADLPTATLFRLHESSVFEVVGSEAPALQLVEVRMLGHQPQAPQPDPFVLTFTGAADLPLGQGIHRLSHPALGELEIFLVPIGYDLAGRPQYEAVFN